MANCCAVPHWHEATIVLRRWGLTLSLPGRHCQACGELIDDSRWPKTWLAWWLSIGGAWTEVHVRGEC